MAEIPKDAKKELFQFGCLRAIAAPVGIDIGITHADYEKVDCTLHHPGSVYSDDEESGPLIKVQLKATESPQFIVQGTYISYPIEKEFCRLVHAEKTNKRFLFVQHCHKDENSWITVDPESNTIKIQHLMYWAGLHDIPKPETNDSMTGTSNIRIPINQIVTGETLKKMLSAQANRRLSILYSLYNREVSDE